MQKRRRNEIPPPLVGLRFSDRIANLSDKFLRVLRFMRADMINVERRRVIDVAVVANGNEKHYSK